MLVETGEAVDTITADMKNRDTGEVVTETLSHNAPQTVHLFDFKFANGVGNDFAQRVYGTGHVPATQSRSGESVSQPFERFEIFASDESRFATISETEFTGKKFEVLQELHELGKYRFVVTDYESKSVGFFSLDTLANEPFWQILSEQRKLDFENYANEVTVHGKTQSDGTYNTVTVSDQDEIDVIGRTVSHFEKKPEGSTQAEVDSRAESLLEEKTSQREESGSIEVVPQQVDVGYTYPVSPWSDAFRYGGRAGQNALTFPGTDGAPDIVEWENGSISETSQRFTFEFLIHPRGLDKLDNDDYMAILSAIGGDGVDRHDDLVILFRDGSVGFGYGDGSTGSDRIRTKLVIVNDRETQRLSIVWGWEIDDHPLRVYVNGILMAKHKDDELGAKELDSDYRTYTLGLDSTGGNPFEGGIDDVRLFLDEARTGDQIEKFAHENLLEHPDANIENLPYYLRFDDRSDTSTATMDGGADYDVPDATITGAQYEASFGRLEEIQYSLGDGGSLSVDFDISGRIDTELVKMRNSVPN